MKLDDGDSMVGVALCTADEDVLLTTALGRCIRFKADDVRVFKGRDSTGVRGVRLQANDEVISMAVLRRMDASPAERVAYLKQANALRRATGESDDEPAADVAEDEAEAAEGEAILTTERFAE